MAISLQRRHGSDITVMDLFCGAGGFSQGAHLAGGVVRLAANHDTHAINTHSANFPDTEHDQVDLLEVDIATMPKVDILIASPSCTNHSQANAKKLYAEGDAAAYDDPEFEAEYRRQERSRCTMLAPLRYADHHRPYYVIIENVVEVTHWGPKRPGKKQGDGSMFRWWMDQWRSLGYTATVLFLNSQFFAPCPQSRDRIYIVFTLDGMPLPDLNHRPLGFCDRCGHETETYQRWKKPTKSWPLPRWGKYRSQYVYACPSCNAELTPYFTPSYTAIDWSDLGERIGERSKPLAPSTRERIRRGIEKFWDYEPFVLTTRNVAFGTDHGVSAAANTQTTRQDKALVTPFTVTAAGNTFVREGDYARARYITEPAFTQHTTASLGVVTPFLVRNYGIKGGDAGRHASSVDEAASTQVASGIHHGLVCPPAMWFKNNGGLNDTANYGYPVDHPVGTVTAHDTTSLVGMPWIDHFYGNGYQVPVTEPSGVATTKERHGLVVPWSKPEVDDCMFRMLVPREIGALMAFWSDYKIVAPTKSIAVQLYGNAVTPPVANWILERVLGAFRGQDPRF